MSTLDAETKMIKVISLAIFIDSFSLLMTSINKINKKNAYVESVFPEEKRGMMRKLFLN